MEENKLIAEFMGGQKILNDCYQLEGLHYHKSWDWIIPVVQKIEVEFEGVPQELINLSLYSNLNEVYCSVVEFIYNYKNNINNL